MASTYVNNLRLEEIGTGEQSGTWGDTTNTNLEIIGQAVAWGTRAIANASTDNITIADGALDADRCLGLKLTGGGQACTVSLLPNTSSKTWFMYNATAADLTFTCGSGANVVIPAGQTKVIATDGLGSGGVVHDLLTAVNLAGTTVVDDLTVSDDLTVTDDLIVGGDIDLEGSIDVNGTTNLDVTNIVGDLTATSDTVIFQSVNSQDPIVMIKNTTNDANGARLSFIKDKGAAAADGDDIGTIAFIGDNAAQEQTTFASIVAEVSESADTDEAGKLSFFVSESNGTSAQLTAGLIIEGEHATDGEVDVTIGAGTTSLTTIKGNMTLNHDGAELLFGDDNDVILAHVHNEGLLLNSTRQLQFNDASQYINAPSATVLDINATDEIELNATLIDVNGNLDVSSKLNKGFIQPNSAFVQTASANLNYWKLGRLYVYGPGGAKLVLYGKAGYSSGGNNEGETILLMRGGTSATALDGLFETRGAAGTSSCIAMGYVPVSGSDYTFDIYAALGNFHSLDHEVVSSGTWETSVSNTGSTSAPTGYVGFTVENNVVLGNVTSHSYNQSSFYINNDAVNMDFRVSSDTNANMLFVDGGANAVGIGTNAPQDILHLNTNNAATHLRMQRFEQDEALVDGDEIGGIEFWANDSTSFSGASTLRAAIRGEIQNTSLGTRLEFWTGNSNATVAERMRIIADGQINFRCTATPSATVSGFAMTSDQLYTSAGNTTNTNTQVRFINGNGLIGSITTSGSATAFNTSSDYRLKENVNYTWDATTRLKQLKPARFNWIADSDNTVQDGFLAHEVSSVVPEAVFGTKDAEIQENGDGYQSIDQSKLVPLLVKTIQELEARITALEG